MSSDIVVKTATVPRLSFPEGAAVEFSIPVPETYDLTGKRVEFAIRTGGGRDPKLFRSSSEEAEITITLQTVTILIPPATLSDVEDSETTLADVACGLTEYRIDFLASESAPVDWRLQGDILWIQKEGGWK